MRLRNFSFGLSQALKVLLDACLQKIYPPFCAHCLLQMERNELLCSSCFSLLELNHNFSYATEFSIFSKTPVTIDLVRQVKSLQGARLVKGIAGLVALQLTELGALGASFYVEKGLEELGRAVEALTQKKFLGPLKARSKRIGYGDILIADPKSIDKELKALAQSRRLRFIYLLEKEEKSH